MNDAYVAQVQAMVDAAVPAMRLHPGAAVVFNWPKDILVAGAWNTIRMMGLVETNRAGDQVLDAMVLACKGRSGHEPTPMMVRVAWDIAREQAAKREVAPQPCPACGYQLDAHAGLHVGQLEAPARRPTAGDVLVCGKCARILVVAEDLQLRVMRPDELDGLEPGFRTALNRACELVAEQRRRPA